MGRQSAVGGNYYLCSLLATDTYLMKPLLPAVETQQSSNPRGWSLDLDPHVDEAVLAFPDKIQDAQFNFNIR